MHVYGTRIENKIFERKSENENLQHNQKEDICELICDTKETTDNCESNI